MYRLDHWKRDLTDMNTSGKITSPRMVLIARGCSRRAINLMRARDFPKGAHIN